MRSPILLVLAVLTLVACNSYKSKIKTKDEGTVTPASIDYEFVNSKVFEPYCVRCHSSTNNKGGVTLETYENVIANLAEVEETALVEKSMPPRRSGGPLGEYEQNLLKQWIEAGAPREAGSVDVEVPTTPSEPEETLKPVMVEPRWESLYTNIFVPKCVECHQAGARAEDYPLTDRAYVIDENNMMVVSGRPEVSELYISVSRTDRRIMPPAKTGMTLSPEEKEAIRIWIINGAKD